MANRDRTGAAVFRITGYRWFLIAVGFVVGACLFVGLSALLLYVVTERGDRIIGSERLRSLLAIALFVTLIAVPTYLLTVMSRDRE